MSLTKCDEAHSGCVHTSFFTPTSFSVPSAYGRLQTTPALRQADLPALPCRSPRWVDFLSHLLWGPPLLPPRALSIQSYSFISRLFLTTLGFWVMGHGVGHTESCLNSPKFVWPTATGWNKTQHRGLPSLPHPGQAALYNVAEIALPCLLSWLRPASELITLLWLAFCTTSTWLSSCWNILCFVMIFLRYSSDWPGALCSPGWSQTCDLSIWVSQVLGLQMSTTTPASTQCLS
jgi:hypothetical protein